MIDEDLYQQAADELNSDRRRPHIWARACALASDDQDEARYLYTNLRVEELLAERTQQETISEQGSIETESFDATVVLEPSLEPSVEASTGDFSDTVGEFSAFLDEENIPQEPHSLSSSQNIAASNRYDDASDALDGVNLDAALVQPTRNDNNAVSDSSPLDDTYAGLEDPTEVFQKELEKLKAEQGGVNIFESTAAFSRHLDGHFDDENNPSSYAPGDLPADVEGDADFHLDPAEIDRLASLDTTTSHYSVKPQVEDFPEKRQDEADLQLEPADTDAATPSFSAAEKQPDTLQTPETAPAETPETAPTVDNLLTEADYRPIGNSADDDGKGAGVDEILADAVYKPAAEPGHSENNLDWLDEEPILPRESDSKREPLIINDDSLEATLDASFFEIDDKQDAIDIAESVQPEEVQPVTGFTDAIDVEIEDTEFDDTARTLSEALVADTETDTETDSAELMQSVDSSLTETLAMTETQLDSVHAVDSPQPDSLADELGETPPPQAATLEPATGEPLEDPSLDGRLEFPTTKDQLAEPSLHGNLSEQPVDTPSYERPLFAPETDELVENVSAPEFPEALSPEAPLETPSFEWPQDSPAVDELSENTTDPDNFQSPSSAEMPLETPSFELPQDAPAVDGHTANTNEQDNFQSPSSAEMPLETPSFELPQETRSTHGLSENTTESDNSEPPAPEVPLTLETPSSEQSSVNPSSNGLSENTIEPKDSQQPLSREDSRDSLPLDTAEPARVIDDGLAAASGNADPILALDEASSAQNSALEATRESDVTNDSSPGALDKAVNQLEGASATDLSEEIENTVADHSDQLSIQPPIDSTTVDGSKAAFAALAATSATSVSMPGQDAATGFGTTTQPMAADAAETTSLPVDLTDGTEGKQYAIYHRRGKTQIVSTRGSWTALILTLPFLVYRHLFGTAVIYSIMAVILLGGLLVSSLAWYDAGESVTPLIQACAIGFGLLSFIGLAYLPFRYGNLWRGEKLERRGFELLALVSADSSGQALTIARRNAQLDI